MPYEESTSREQVITLIMTLLVEAFFNQTFQGFQER